MRLYIYHVSLSPQHVYVVIQEVTKNRHPVRSRLKTKMRAGRVIGLQPLQFLHADKIRRKPLLYDYFI